MHWLTSAQKAGRWENTHDSAFCLLASHEYLRVWEGVQPDFQVDVRFSFMTKKVGNETVTANVGKAFIAEIERQLGQDIPIWEHKVMKDRPVLCDGDGPIGLFRRWCKQFYLTPPPTNGD